jgi:tetratricopeptide (TPR) repeat protein
MADEVRDWDEASLRRLGEALRDVEYDKAIQRACAFATRHQRRQRREREQEERAVEALRRMKRPRGALPPQPPRGFGPIALCNAYLRLSLEMRYEDPWAMKVYARGAVQEIMEADPNRFPPGVIYDLRARAYIELANAQRVCEKHSSADDLLERAKKWFKLGTGNPTLSAYIDELEASLRIEQRRFVEAAHLLDRAHDLYLDIGEPHLAGRTLMSRARLAWIAGAAKELILRFFERSLELLDRERDPELVAAAFHNRIVCLTEHGCYQEAGELLLESGLRRTFAGQPLKLIRLRWLEARIQAGIGRLDRAEAIFQEVWQSFQGFRLEFDAALAGLDLAEVWLRQGKDRQLAALAAKIGKTFQAVGLPKEAALAFDYLRVAAEMQMVDLTFVSRTRQFLVDLRGNPNLAFDIDAIVDDD